VSLTISSDQSNSAPPIDNALRPYRQLNQFLSFFPSRHGSLVKRNMGHWRTMSQYHSLSDDEIVQSLSDGSLLKRACSFETATKFAAIHIPSESRFYESDQLEYIRTALGQIAPYIKLYQCDDDRYLYIFFEALESSSAVSNALQKALLNAGIEISDTTVRVYPACANFIPLPLQPGFAWLSPTGQTIMQREEVSLESAVALFLFDAQKNAISGTFFFDTLANMAVQGPKIICAGPAERLNRSACNQSLALQDEDVSSTILRHDSASPSETLLPNLVHLIQLPDWVNNRQRYKRKTLRAPPQKLRNCVTYRCHSPDSRRSSCGRY
jgi:hypothetical protein